MTTGTGLNLKHKIKEDFDLVVSSGRKRAGSN